MNNSLELYCAKLLASTTLFVSILEDYSRRTRDMDTSQFLGSLAQRIDRTAYQHFQDGAACGVGLAVTSSEGRGQQFHYATYKDYLFSVHTTTMVERGIRNLNLAIMSEDVFQHALLALQSALKEKNTPWIDLLKDEAAAVGKAYLALSSHHTKAQHPNALSFALKVIPSTKNVSFVETSFDGHTIQYLPPQLVILRFPNDENTIPGYAESNLGGQSGRFVPCNSPEEDEFFDRAINSFFNSLEQ